jgi:putative chitinase
MMDVSTLVACTGATQANAERFAVPLSEAMAQFSIASPSAVACLLGQVAIESEGAGGPLSAIEEGLYYSSPDRLREIFPSLFVKGGYKAEDYARNPSALSQLRYKGYHGRGLIQLTWIDTYRAAGEALGFDYVANPALVLQPTHAALTACWFFAAYKGCMPAAERGDVFEITGLVNGLARLKLEERKAVTARALGVLAKQ